MQEETLFSPEPNLPADVIVTATDHRNCAEEANPKSILKSVIFPSLLEQAVKEDFNYLINELGNLDNQVKTLPVQTENKRKGHSTFGLKKLRNFLSRSKFRDEETVEKEYDRINGNLHKVNDSEICNKPKGQEKSEISLSDSIKQLSTTDYSSLFQ